MHTSSPATQTPRPENPDFKGELLGLVPFLRAFARSLTGNQEAADDLAQETLVKAWQSRASFIPGTNLKAWLFTILRNQFYSDRRRAWRQAPWDQDAAERIPGGGEDQVHSAELSDTVRALKHLSDEQREALILVGAGGFSYEDAAAICKCAVGTVKSRVARARKTLIEILDGGDSLGDVSRPAGGDAAREIMAQLDELSPGRSEQQVGKSATSNFHAMTTHEPGWTLRQRLQVIITLSLIPVILVSLFQGVARARLDIANVHDRLIQSARTVAAGDQNLLASAEQVLRAVGSLSEVRGMNGNCDGVLADTLIGVRYFSNLTRVDQNGRVTCSAMALARGLNVGDYQVFKDAKVSTQMAVSNELTSRVTGQSVIGGMLALHKPDGSFDGTVAITLDVHWIDYMMRASQLPKGAVVAVYDRSGKVIATNSADVGNAIAKAAIRSNAGSEDVYSAIDGRGDKWRFANARLSGNSIFVAFAMGEGRLFGPTYLHVGLDFLLPILMIGFAWVAIWLATDRQMTQWINYLRRIAAAYRSGHYAIRPDLADAPTEFRLLGDALAEMADGIQDRDRRLRENVEMKTTLIKEIHHRVKNNLQIVMSLLSIQAQQVKDVRAKEALMQAQTRINALALVHRILNELEDQSTLDIRQLLEELSHQIAGGMSNDAVTVDVDVPSRVVAGSVAVALALFTVEVLTNIFKHAYPNDRRGVIRVTMTTLADGKLKLAIADDGIGFATDSQNKSVGSRLIKTFGLQLGGVSSVQSEPGRGTVVDLVFPDPDLRENPPKV